MATSGIGISTPATPASGTYTLRRIVGECRTALDDTVEPYLWPDEELTSYVALIQRRMCDEMPLIEDRNTSSVARYGLVLGQTTVTLSPNIVGVSRAILESQTAPLEVCSVGYMDMTYPGWMDSVTTGIPTILVTEGLGTGVARLYPPLAAATDNLILTVIRDPIFDLDWSIHADLPLEIDKYSIYMINGVISMAYMKHDADTEDVKKAMMYTALYNNDKERVKRTLIKGQGGANCALMHPAFS